MRRIQNKFRDIYLQLEIDGEVFSPRRQLTKEIRNFSAQFSVEERYIGFQAKTVNMTYLKEELKWYINGDRKDLSIAEHASIWKDCVHNGMLQSNYGFYLFNENVWSYINRLFDSDLDTRRAVININSPFHNHIEAKDVPCTMYVAFYIRHGHLNMDVRMRSQDAIFGLYNDLPFFQFVLDCYYWSIKVRHPEIMRGLLHLHVDSFHVYERHFDLLSEIIREDPRKFRVIEVPYVHRDEVIPLILDKKKDLDFPFSRWLHGTT